MASKPKQKLIIAFDLYGTLLDTSSISTGLRNALAPETSLSQDQADHITAKWRQYQLEYTWRLSSMSSSSSSSSSSLQIPYIPFDKITRASLLHACAEARINLPDAKADDLLAAYDSLQAYAEVLPALQALQTAARTSEAVEAVVFSNGTETMLANSIATSPTLKLLTTPVQAPEGAADSGGRTSPPVTPPVLFSKLISVEAVEKYKPQRDVYEHLLREAAGSGGDYSEAQAAVWLVSANAFDVVGARAAGLRAVWVDRKGTGWVDRLGDVISEAGSAKSSLTPTIVVKGVDEAVEKILAEEKI